MRVLAPKPLLMLLSASLIFWIFGWEQNRTLAPPISAAHAQEPELVSREGCEQCHGNGGGRAAMVRACVICHEGIGEDLESEVGLHGSQVEQRIEDCTRCHIEHAGRDFPLVSETSFVEAGFGALEEYVHEGLGPEPYGLSGAHDELDCEQCHEKAGVVLLEKGWQRFRGLSQACDSCHDDPHEGAMIEACADCHGQTQKFEEHAEFVHPERFPLTAAHGEQECKKCHEKDSPFSIEAVAGDKPPVDRTCEACHEHQHSTPFLKKSEALAFELGLIEAGTPGCLICHEPEHDGLGAAEEFWSVELHAASGMALLEPHADIECAECHFKVPDPPDAQADWVRRFPGREAADCEACHEDPHGGQFARKIPVQNACLECHSETHFVPAGFGFEAHAKTDFPLQDKHRAVACFACHKVPENKPESPRSWSDIPSACADCHADAHAGAFDDLVERAEFEGRIGCARCHTTQGFEEIIQEEFKHGELTDFALNGAHQKAECEVCHLPARTPDEFGRSFGRIAAQWGSEWQPEKACVLCHADPHAGIFERVDLPVLEGGQADCARCHTENDWQELRTEKFDHHFWTDYELSDGHDRAECEACHLPTGTPDRLGRSFGRIEAIHGSSDPSCQACHADPHFGIFDAKGLPIEVDGGATCARCHNLNSFAQLLVGAPEEFDHDLWTASQTASEHGKQGCDDCHPPIDKGVGLGVLLQGLGRRGRARGAAPGRTCAACHADEHRSQFQRPETEACDTCHASQSDFAVLDFDHQTDSRYKLDDVHKDVACAACHGPVTWPDGGSTVLYRPLGMECVDCHTAGGRPPESGRGER